MNTLSLIDRTFNHSILGYCSDYQSSNIFRWNRQSISGDVVYTDMVLNQVKENLNGDNYAWLIEPIEIAPQNYELIEKLKHKFKKVFTHEKKFLDKGSPYSFVPFGCCWIDKKDHHLYEKNKNISIISSNKKITTGHILRHSVINAAFNGEIDIYGRGFNPIIDKIEGLKDYRFSIVIENCKRDYWFTEKLIDCFATGTIPIYWGCPSIDKFFNKNGIITFNDLNELNNIITEIIKNPVTEYENRIVAVKDNLNRSNSYLLPDEYIYKCIHHNESINLTQ